MAERKGSRERLLGVAAVVLLVTAGLNALGYVKVAERLTASGIEVTWSSGLKAMWLIFSSHLAFMALIVALCSLRPGLVNNVVIQVCALIPTVDSVVLFAWVLSPRCSWRSRPF